MLAGESPEEISDRLEEWREALESKRLRSNRSETEYI